MENLSRDYDPEDILAVVEYLYNSEELESARKFAAFMVLPRNDFLRDPYEKTWQAEDGKPTHNKRAEKIRA